ncbi:MAG: M1 family aminopeptidase [Ktedonobacteraceae bacterium]
MKGCDHGYAQTLAASYNFYRQSDAAPPPRARAFELPGDRVQYAPDRPADIQHVKLDIALDFDQETISGTAYTTFSALYDEVQTVWFDAVELHIERVTLEHGQELAYSVEPGRLVVTLDRAYRYGEVFTVAVRYHAKPRIGLTFVKPAPEDPARPLQAWTFGQTNYHSYWFPCHWVPNDRATSEIIATVPAQFITISNGNLLSVTGNGATKTHHWRHDVPHPAYLMSLVVGDFAVIKDRYNGKPVTYYVRPDRQDDAPFLFGKTPEMMRFFSEYLAVEYPYDTYDQTVIEVYTGAMEHTTATSHSFMLLLDERASLDIDMVSVVAHELAHQWFGDLLTCRDWANGWLNEGFATYMEELWSEHDLGNDYFKHSMLDLKRAYLHEDREYRRPVVYNVYRDDGFELFDSHLYCKGGWVLHMLRHQLGEAAFRRGLHAYIERNRGREVITADLERTLEDVTGRSLAQFFRQWLYQGGYPAFEVSYDWDSEHHMAKVKIKQTQHVDDLTPCFVTPVDLAFTIPASAEPTQAADGQPAHKTVPLRVIAGEDGQVEQTFYLPLEREPVMVRFDPDGWLLKTLTFKRSNALMRYQLAHDPDVLGRIEAAEALGEAGDAESIQALITALFSDDFWGVRAAVAEALGKIGSEQAQDALLRGLRELDPAQFSRVRAAIARAMGRFQVPQQAELAQRSAQTLGALVEQGDVSYVVESAAAEALGKTRTTGAVEQLVKLIEPASWNAFVQRGVFSGLAATGDERVIDIIAGYLSGPPRPPLLRLAAAGGMVALGHQRHLYSEDARQRAVTALSQALEHDPWVPVRATAATALLALGEKRAIAALELTAGRELDSRAQRTMREAIHGLRSDGKSDEQFRQLRADLDQVREENRKLKEQMGALEQRLP